MTIVAFPASTGGGLQQAVESFLDGIPTTTTRAAYAPTLVGQAGAGTPVEQLSAELYAAVMVRWNGAAAATWNKHLSALVSFTTWAQRQDLLSTNPTRRLARRKVTRRGDRSIPQARLEALFTDDRHALRERVLWRMLYETAARAQEILCMDVPDLDPAFRRARVTSKGGAIEYVSWATATARLLPRLLAGRATGPVFLADRRAPTRGHCAPAADDIDPTTGRGRLSYPRAEYLFNRPPPPMIPTVRAGPCTSCGTSACNTWPRLAAARPNCRPRAATSTWPASGSTSTSGPRQQPASPPTTTPPPDADTTGDGQLSCVASHGFPVSYPASWLPSAGHSRRHAACTCREHWIP